MATRTAPEVVALIPARNEPAIVATVLSLRSQTLAPGTIVLVANNCAPDDKTAALAKALGCTVLNMQHNEHKKAGALNRGYEYIRLHRPQAQYILQMDADTELEPHFVERTVAAMEYADSHATRARGDKRIGALSCAFYAKERLAQTAWQQVVMWPQAVEYTCYQDSTIRPEAGVVSGTACLLRIEALEAIYLDRGMVWSIHALAEDFELTLKLRQMGWSCRKSKKFVAYTDLMPSLRDLIIQRERWQRGTVDGLRAFSLTSFTWYEWARQALHGLLMLAQLAGFALCGWFLSQGQPTVNPLVLIVFTGLAVMGLVRAYHVREMGLVSILLGLILVPEIAYNLLRHVWWTKGLVMSLCNAKSTWA